MGSGLGQKEGRTDKGQRKRWCGSETGRGGTRLGIRDRRKRSRLLHAKALLMKYLICSSCVSMLFCVLASLAAQFSSNALSLSQCCPILSPCALSLRSALLMLSSYALLSAALSLPPSLSYALLSADIPLPPSLPMLFSGALSLFLCSSQLCSVSLSLPMIFSCALSPFYLQDGDGHPDSPAVPQLRHPALHREHARAPNLLGFN